MKNTCVICGKDKGKNEKYCSYKCAGMGKRKHEYNKVCKTCGEHFEAIRKEMKFCSKDCASENRVVNHPLHVCHICNKEFRKAEYRLRGAVVLCSKECNCEYMRRKKNIDVKEVKVSFKCKWCGKIHETTLLPYKARIFEKRKFCNASCTNHYRYRKEDDCE